MTFTSMRVIESFFALIRKSLTNVLEYQDTHQEFPLPDSIIEKYLKNFVLLALCWGLGGSIELKLRSVFSNKLGQLIQEKGLIEDLLLNDQYCPIDYEVRLEDG
jgi:dynein heavy chain 1